MAVARLMLDNFDHIKAYWIMLGVGTAQTALAYGAEGVAMGTRFLLTSDSTVPDEVKRRYLDAALDGTVVSTRVDGMPDRKSVV